MMNIVAMLMIVFGVAEVVTGTRHEFFGLVTATDSAATILGVLLGSCYIAGGILVLVFTRRTLFAAAILLAIDIIGRLAMILAGLYPMTTVEQTVGIVGGTLIAAIFLLLILLRVRRMP
jgi:hypothetical protein